MENKKTPETLTPEQMESGKWYVVKSKHEWLFKFSKIELDAIFAHKQYSYTTTYRELVETCLVNTKSVKSIRPATSQEVLKYFPDEVFEPIELRPEDLKVGKVYKATDEKHGHWWIFQHLESNTKYVIHSRCIDYEKDFEGKGEFIANNFKYYHATPEEKKLLLGEEQTDWEAKYNELKAKYDDLKQAATESNLALKEKLNQLEPKGEKVYFYHDGISWSYSKSLDDILVASREDYEIYQAIIIGKKKSVLVSE